mgnify:CR=1 FL=1
MMKYLYKTKTGSINQKQLLIERMQWPGSFDNQRNWGVISTDAQSSEKVIAPAEDLMTLREVNYLIEMIWPVE